MSTSSPDKPNSKDVMMEEDVSQKQNHVEVMEYESANTPLCENGKEVEMEETTINGSGDAPIIKEAGKEDEKASQSKTPTNIPGQAYSLANLRANSKFLSGVLTRWQQSRTIFAGPVEARFLGCEELVSQLTQAYHANIRKLQIEGTHSLCLLELVYHTEDAADSALNYFRNLQLGDIEIQASRLSDVKQSTDQKPPILHFLDFSKLKVTEEQLLNINLCHAYDRLSKLWVYVENVPADWTCENIKENLEGCLEAIIVNEKQIYAYAAFNSSQLRDSIVLASRKGKGYKLANDHVLRIYPVDISSRSSIRTPIDGRATSATGPRGDANLQMNMRPHFRPRLGRQWSMPVSRANFNPLCMTRPLPNAALRFVGATMRGVTPPAKRSRPDLSGIMRTPANLFSNPIVDRRNIMCTNYTRTIQRFPRPPLNFGSRVRSATFPGGRSW